VWSIVKIQHKCCFYVIAARTKYCPRVFSFNLKVGRYLSAEDCSAFEHIYILSQHKSCRKGLWRCLIISSKELPINEEIRDKEVRVIDADGSQLGILPIKEAQRTANEKNLDLVMIAPQAVPPVCRIMDYGKFRFEQAKREKEAKKNQKVIDIKEVRLSLNIDTHDFNTKVNHAAKFLADGDKVKVSIRFRGREMAHPELGEVIMKRFADACANAGTVEKQPKMEGRSMTMFISAKPVK